MSATRSLRLVLLLIAGSLVLPSAAAQAALRRWTPFGPPAGGILDLVADPSTAGLLYIVMDSGQVFRSRDGGASWSWSGAGLTSGVFALTPDPRHSGTLWAAGPDAVFRSNDHGGRWSRVSGPDFQPFPPPGPTTEQILLAAVPGSRPADPAILLFSGVALGPILRSTDGGRTWSALPELGLLWFLRTDARGRVQASLLHGGGLWRSGDAGLSWQRLGAIPEDVQDLAAVAARPRILYATTQGAVWRSGNDGATWRNVFPAPERYRFTALAVDPRQPSLVYAAAAEDSITGPLPSVWVSRDAGGTWQETSHEISDNVIVRMIVEPARRIVYGAAYGELAVSPDLGRTWNHETVVPTGSIELGARDHLRFDPRDPSRVYAVAGELFTSADGGRSWCGSPSRIDDLSDVAFDPVRRGFLYGVALNSILLSKDGGSTWSPYAPAGGLTLAFLTPRTAVLAGEGLLRSTDRGRTWTRVVSGNPQGFVDRLCDRLAVDPADAQHLFAGCFTFDFSGAQIEFIAREMWQSRDGALSWTVDLHFEDVMFDPAHPGTVYGLSISGSLERSLDGGGSWEPAGDPGGRVFDIAVDPGSGAVYALLETGRVEASRDGGDTWTPVGGAGTPRRSYDGFWAHPTRPGRLYCVAELAFYEMSVPEN